MKVIDKSVLILREAVNYIAGSDAHLCTFEKCVTDSKCNFVGKLRALEAKDALVLFAIIDSSFEFNLTSDEWTTVQFMCRFLDPFHSITELFSRYDYPTSNLYFANVLAIEKLLVLGNNHEWGDYSTLLAIVVVLDPQYKMWRHGSRKSMTHL
ncbi:Zinc finger BED domain-containing protein RICESLEEPER 2 [Bienertia sinuspersici]